MKLRIQGDSLRLRVSRSELDRLIKTGRIEETLHFGVEKELTLTYALEHAEIAEELSLRACPQSFTVILSTASAHRWAQEDEVGLSRDLKLGDRVLALLVEKDFACLDRSEAENEDTFSNPMLGATC